MAQGSFVTKRNRFRYSSAMKKMWTLATAANGCLIIINVINANVIMSVVCGVCFFLSALMLSWVVEE